MYSNYFYLYLYFDERRKHGMDLSSFVQWFTDGDNDMTIEEELEDEDRSLDFEE